jgi:hypothetical protein
MNHDLHVVEPNFRGTVDSKVGAVEGLCVRHAAGPSFRASVIQAGLSVTKQYFHRFDGGLIRTPGTAGIRVQVIEGEIIAYNKTIIRTVSFAR